jgi:hypothetical protein
VAHDSAQVQNKKAGKPERPKTSISTTKMLTTVHATRPTRAAEDRDIGPKG